MNGGEGPVGQTEYLVLPRLEDLLKTNTLYRVGEFAPGLLLIGSDGGGEGYALDTRSRPMGMVAVPFVGMDLDDATTLDESFDSFVQRLSRS